MLCIHLVVIIVAHACMLNIATYVETAFTYIPCNNLLSQVCASLRPARACFLKIDPVRIVGMPVCVCVCVPAPEAINN